MKGSERWWSGLNLVKESEGTHCQFHRLTKTYIFSFLFASEHNPDSNSISSKMFLANPINRTDTYFVGDRVIYTHTVNMHKETLLVD